MAAASTWSPPLLLLRTALSAHPNPNGGNPRESSIFFRADSKPSSLLLRAPPRRFAAVAFARRSKTNSRTPQGERSKHKEKVEDDKGVGNSEVDELDEDAFEALFSQLEEDLKNDDLLDDEFDDEITEEDLAKLEKELSDALGVDDYDDDSSEVSPTNAGTMDDEEEAEEEEEEEEEEEMRPKLKNWQVRRLAHALKIGRRKTSIKNLAAELGLDRAFVLELLRDPPPNILLMTASLPDKVTETANKPELEPEPEPEPETTKFQPTLEVDAAENESEVREPVHVMQTRWFMQKRLKKVQVETLERVYSQTKRPTNSMINSIVHVTNLPWKRVVKWFEDKRLQDGIPERRVPFRRSLHDTISTS